MCRYVGSLTVLACFKYLKKLAIIVLLIIYYLVGVSIMSSSNVLHVSNDNLLSIIEKIKKGVYLIPSFQRGFTWKLTDIRMMADSLLWQYPISSLLFTPPTDFLNIQARTIVDRRGANPEEVLYVLDGQQRLTALAHLFVKGACIDSKYYFDLLAIVSKGIATGRLDLNASDEHHDKEYYLEFLASGLTLSKKATEGEIEKFRAGTLPTCKTFKLPTGSNSRSRKDDSRYISCEDFIGQNADEYTDLFVEVHFGKDKQLDNRKVRKIQSFLCGLITSLKSYTIPYTRIDAAADLSVICNVFERINTTGIKLTTFDLVNAKSFNSDKFSSGLLNFLHTNINKWKNVNSIAFIEKEYPDYGMVLRILFIADRLAQHSRPDGLTNAELLKKSPDYWHSMWSSKSLHMELFLQKASKSGLLKWGVRSFVEYLIAIFLAKPELLNDQEFWNYCIKTSLALSIAGTLFNKYDLNQVTTLYNYGVNRIKAAAHLKHVISVPAIAITGELDSELALRISYAQNSSPRNRAAIELMYGTTLNRSAPLDLAGDPIYLDYENSKSVEEHHLVPLNGTSRSSKSPINSVANLVVLSPSKNKSIGSQEVSKYLKDMLYPIYNVDLAKFDKILKDNFLPRQLIVDLITKNIPINPDSLWELRSELITQRILEVLGTHLSLDSAITTTAEYGIEDEIEDEDLLEENGEI